jgi:hypothetical protein
MRKKADPSIIASVVVSIVETAWVAAMLVIAAIVLPRLFR